MNFFIQLITGLGVGTVCHLGGKYPDLWSSNFAVLILCYGHIYTRLYRPNEPNSLIGTINRWEADTGVTQDIKMGT